jgi:hypothetical protein
VLRSGSPAELPSFSTVAHSCARRVQYSIPVSSAIISVRHLGLEGRLQSSNPFYGTSSRHFGDFHVPVFRFTVFWTHNVRALCLGNSMASAAACRLKQPAQPPGQPVKTPRSFMACSQDRDHLFGEDMENACDRPHVPLLFPMQSRELFAQTRQRFEFSYRIMKVEHDTAKAKRSRPTLSLGRKLPPPFVLIASGV